MSTTMKRPSIRERVEAIPVQPMLRAEGHMMVLRFTLNEDGLLSIQGEDENHSQVTASREPFEPGKDRDADIYVLEALKHLYRRSGR